MYIGVAAEQFEEEEEAGGGGRLRSILAHGPTMTSTASDESHR